VLITSSRSTSNVHVNKSTVAVGANVMAACSIVQQ